jgi:hypothetical protein
LILNSPYSALSLKIGEPYLPVEATRENTFFDIEIIKAEHLLLLHLFHHSGEHTLVIFPLILYMNATTLRIAAACNVLVSCVILLQIIDFEGSHGERKRSIIDYCEICKSHGLLVSRLYGFLTVYATI